MEDFTVTLDAFEGPLDLMLHLIKEKELDIYDLDVNALTDQYIAYLNAMEVLHLEIAAEYLVELAELIEYKSRKLLPKDDSEIGDEYEEDPKDRLVRRLLEYQQFKEASTSLSQLFEERQEHFGKPMSDVFEEWKKEPEDFSGYQGNPYDLKKAMERCLMRLQLQKPLQTKYAHKEISMEERELQIRSRLITLPETFSFETLIDDCHDLPMFIATFLAVLDLARLHTLIFTINEKDEIWFSRGSGLQA